jgi:hypothetical protein
MCRKLTTNVVRTTTAKGAPCPMRAAPMNWAEPEKTSDDMPRAGPKGIPALMASAP